MKRYAIVAEADDEDGQGRYVAAAFGPFTADEALDIRNELSDNDDGRTYVIVPLGSVAR